MTDLTDSRFESMATDNIIYRDATNDDTATVCTLNRIDEVRLSPMDPERFAALRAAACYCKVAQCEGEVAAFLIGFSDGADYDSDNYRWFDARMKNFFYIDRIVVDARFRGRGLASGLYRDVQAHARDHALHWLAAEIDIEPPNPVSLAFHSHLGFSEIGTQVTGSGKTVSLQLGPVPPA